MMVYPEAKLVAQRMKTRGKYDKGYPKGAVVHFTAGHFGSVLDAVGCINEGIKNGYAYLCIASDGTVVQAHSIDEWGYHAGESAWTNVTVGKLVGTVSDDLIGIEINNAGKLTVSNGLYKSWYGKIIPASEVRYVEEASYGCPSGHYHKYTEAQEAALIKLLLWLKRNDPTGSSFSFDDVLGHHEVAGKKGIGYWRKNDPGGSLSMSMEAFRAKLKNLAISESIQGGVLT